MAGRTVVAVCGDCCTALGVVAGERDLDPPEVSYLAASAIRQLDVAGVVGRGVTRPGETAN
jgi:hypothetical protein